MFLSPQPFGVGATRRGPRPSPCVRLTLLVGLGSRLAFAQSPPTTPAATAPPPTEASPTRPTEATPPPAQPPAPATDADLASIEAALAKDTAAASSPPPTSAPSSPR